MNFNDILTISAAVTAVVTSIVSYIYGTHALQEKREKLFYTAENTTFFKLYTDTLSTGLSLIRDISFYNEFQITQAINGCLSLVCSLVKVTTFWNSEAEVNASLMIFIPLNSLEPNYFNKEVPFVDNARREESYIGILRPIISTLKEASQFDIPVDDDPQRAIFGAPHAFLTGEVQAIYDTQNINQTKLLLLNQPYNVIQQVADYLSHRGEARGFISLPLNLNNQNSGVVNIWSDRRLTIAKRTSEVAQLQAWLSPLLTLLALLVEQYKKVDGKTNNAYTGNNLLKSFVESAEAVMKHGIVA